MNDKIPVPYKNHSDEWRDIENQIKYEREQIRKQVDPRDPSYIAPARKCLGCGTDIEDLSEEFETCHSCYFNGLD
ncbi:hypothetical protein J2T13_000842 [Paenibacillus sp. DS2015]|uniref:hypothetical protein n=1 Tax=Paenibacillus sp. DS2015 TaxID=3373917 RepID=UPI003D243AC3